VRHPARGIPNARNREVPMSDDVLDNGQGGTSEVPPPPPESAPPPPPPPAMQPASPARVKADLGKRFLAALIDGLLSGVVGLIPVIGGLAGAAYMLVRDGLELDFMDQRSIGKKVMKLRPIRLDGQPMDMATSVKRNIPFAIGPLAGVFIVIPVAGWIVGLLLGIVSLIVVLIEIVLVLTDADGRRMGDKLADTMVVEVDD